jgi:hypothetical protein
MTSVQAQIPTRSAGSREKTEIPAGARGAITGGDLNRATSLSGVADANVDIATSTAELDRAAGHRRLCDRLHGRRIVADERQASATYSVGTSGDADCATNVATTVTSLEHYGSALARAAAYGASTDRNIPSTSGRY